MQKPAEELQFRKADTHQYSHVWLHDASTPLYYNEGFPDTPSTCKEYTPSEIEELVSTPRRPETVQDQQAPRGWLCPQESHDNCCSREKCFDVSTKQTFGHLTKQASTGDFERNATETYPQESTKQTSTRDFERDKCIRPFVRSPGRQFVGSRTYQQGSMGQSRLPYVAENEYRSGYMAEAEAKESNRKSGSFVVVKNEHVAADCVAGSPRVLQGSEVETVEIKIPYVLNPLSTPNSGYRSQPKKRSKFSWSEALSNPWKAVEHKAVGSREARLKGDTHEDRDEHQWEQKLAQLRKAHVAKDAQFSQQQVSKLQAGCWMSRDNEKHIEGWQDTSNSLSPRTAKINACKVRMKEKMQRITHLAHKSPLSKVPADEAVRFFADRLGLGDMDQATFLEATKELTGRFKQRVSDEHVIEVFKALDIDDTGMLDQIEWISSVPLFYGAGIDVAKATFAEIDQDKSGALDQKEFGHYCLIIINMLVPSDDMDLRDTLREYLAKLIFAEIDTDGSGTIDAYEFTEWSQFNSLGSAAIRCLDMIVRGEASNRKSLKPL